MTEDNKSLNFLEQIVEEDLKGSYTKEDLRFRFPPEPNGYLHIGHCKAICISFGLGEKYGAPVNLRFDDTNPAKEEQEYVDAIKEDVSWLGYQWDKECFSSDYFQQLYDWTVQLIKDGKAYVDSQSSEAMAEQKGTPTQPGVPGPYRDRTVEENLDLFARMKAGEFKEGEHILRAKIDMAHVNMLMRDPIIYRVLHKDHHRTGSDWCIYPMYDWTHGESDYIEQVSHSLCSLEFKPHRELYDWFLDQVYSGEDLRPKQREFARLNLNYTIMSKRKLLTLVEKGVVSGWDDPRMPTISGLRRRGYTAAAIRNFIDAVGVAKRENVIDVALLEFHIRQDLNNIAPRVMAVLDPVKLVITNYPEGKEEWLDAENNPEDEAAGERKVPFSRELYIEREDFKENAGNKYFRLTTDKEVRLKNSYIIKGGEVIRDENGVITEIHCTYDPESRSGSGTEASKRNVKGTLHWVSIAHAIKAEVRLFDRLFSDENPDGHEDKDFMEFINPNSLTTITGYLEPSLKDVEVGDIFQFQRKGYFNVDKESTADHLIFNRTVGLRDSWAKVKPKQAQGNTQGQAKPQQQQKASALSTINKLGKKLANLPEDKRIAAVADIQKLAASLTEDEVKGFFNTSAKKVGTRIAGIESLYAFAKAQNKTIKDIEGAVAFVEKAKEDSNDILQEAASKF
ncbi:glutaminyl-tRNA synthetase [Dokdonia sp. Hel_I_63]|uniref:glutamine--tRNA ligase/YqeY domain fusion protein n=1 Tax=unclassified Dokdonia TaxID=2615033 RepID=UPI00020A713B|nr:MULTISPECIES: glutamine--tRNA ligase/YqeY domain fusion protein [unclassified Dokdonia]AEE19149.1 glutaminyl-tRNA synthetase [Dokdonia sp. 4H-3-7-5]TVZ21614.1 glutaminyl-tRNA synthetase [Dokdonia sp. Hel_I_63]